MEITARVIKVLVPENGTSKAGNKWAKQSFVVETDGQYPKKICMQLFGDKMLQIPSEGDVVTVSFDIVSHEYQGKWYTQIEAWRVTKQGMPEAAVPLPQAVQPQQGWQQAYPQPQPQVQEVQPETLSGEEDLPF